MTLHIRTFDASSFLNPDNSEHSIRNSFGGRKSSPQHRRRRGRFDLTKPTGKNLLCMRSDDILSALNLDIEQKGGLLMQPKIEEMSLIRLFTQMEAFSVATDNFLIMMFLLDKA